MNDKNHGRVGDHLRHCLDKVIEEVAALAGGPLISKLVEKRYITSLFAENCLASWCATKGVNVAPCPLYQYPLYDTPHGDIDERLADLYGRKFCYAYLCIPVQEDVHSNRIRVTMARPDNTALVARMKKEIQATFRKRHSSQVVDDNPAVEICVSTQGAIEWFISFCTTELFGL
ncbi:MAG: hypothetical protein V2A74_14620 [bacterium]